MSRVAINLAIENSAALQLLGLPADGTFQANAADTISIRPFVVIRWEENRRAFADKGTQGLTVWVHDDLGDYTRIDNILEKIKEILTAMVHVQGSDQRIVTQVDWSGDSGDLYDDGYRTITRNAGFRVLSRSL
jgi:hypothetical protein